MNTQQYSKNPLYKEHTENPTSQDVVPSYFPSFFCALVIIGAVYLFSRK